MAITLFLEDTRLTVQTDKGDKKEAKFGRNMSCWKGKIQKRASVTAPFQYM